MRALYVAGILLVGLAGCSRPSTEPTHQAAEVAHSARDAELFSQLDRLKPDLSKPRHTVFYLYFPSREQAEAADVGLAGSSLGSESSFATEIAEAEREWRLKAEAVMVVNPERIASLRRELIVVAAKNGGEYDGWETAATP